MFEIRKINGMKGLFALKSFQKGESVVKVSGQKIDHPTRTSVQVGINEHIDVQAPIMYINHRCDANIKLKNYTFVAIRTIEVGEEITFDYNASEDRLSNPFICRDCGQLVKGKAEADNYCCLGELGKQNVKKETLMKF